MSLKVRLLLTVFIFNDFYLLIIGGNIPPVPAPPTVKVHKCCPGQEIINESKCVNATQHNVNPWEPIFTDEQGRTNIQIKPKLVIGTPQCGSRQAFSIFYYRSSSDKLSLLPNGRLRHYFLQHIIDNEVNIHEINNDESDLDNPTDNQKYYDYEPGAYCMDKVCLY